MRRDEKSTTTNPVLAEVIRKVIVESPYRASTPEKQEENIRYAWKCIEDCLSRKEAPFASHLLYAHLPSALDSDPFKRDFGIEAGLTWGKCADATVVYVDLGISYGMKLGIARAEAEGRPVIYRRLGLD